jgi:hypothetical protein
MQTETMTVPEAAGTPTETIPESRVTEGAEEKPGHHGK